MAGAYHIYKCVGNKFRRKFPKELFDERWLQLKQFYADCLDKHPDMRKGTTLGYVCKCDTASARFCRKPFYCPCCMIFWRHRIATDTHDFVVNNRRKTKKDWLISHQWTAWVPRGVAVRHGTPILLDGSPEGIVSKEELPANKRIYEKYQTYCNTVFSADTLALVREYLVRMKSKTSQFPDIPTYGFAYRCYIHPQPTGLSVVGVTRQMVGLVSDETFQKLRDKKYFERKPDEKDWGPEVSSGMYVGNSHRRRYTLANDYNKIHNLIDQTFDIVPFRYTAFLPEEFVAYIDMIGKSQTSSCLGIYRTRKEALT